MREIPLTKGKVAIVDDEDFEMLSLFKWQVNGGGYSVSNKNGIKILMHRLIAKTPKGMFTDHINGDRLDNRRVNLRICTNKENIRNTKPNLNSVVKSKGVSLQWGKYRAGITVNGKRKHLGCFNTELEAAKVYDNAAVKYFGPFARLNFPETQQIIKREFSNTLFN